jgi:HAMP domain-containing protein
LPRGNCANFGRIRHGHPALLASHFSIAADDAPQRTAHVGSISGDLLEITMFRNVKIKTVSMAAPIVMVLLILIVGALGFYSSHLVRTVTVNNHASAISRTAIRLDMETNRSQILQALQHNPDFAWSRLHDHPLTVHFNTIDTVSARLGKRWEQYLASITDAEERRLAQDWFTASEGLGLEPVKAAAAAIRTGRWDDAEDTLIKRINPRYRVGDTAMHELSTLADSHAQQAEERLSTMQTRIAYASAIVLVVGTVLGTAVALVLMSAVVRPLSEAVAVAGRVADGDLTGTIDSRGSNEIGQLRQRQRGAHGHRPDRQRRAPGPVGAHRRAGQLARTDGGVDGRAGVDGQEQCRQCAPGEYAGARGLRLWPSAAGRWWPRWSARWTRSTTSRKIADITGVIDASPSRPISSPSTRRWKRRARANMAAALPWSPRKCATWRSARPQRRRRSRR